MKRSTRNAIGLAVLLALALAFISCTSSRQDNKVIIEIPVDRTAPIVMSVSPANGEASVAPDTSVVINFSEPIDQNTVTTSSVKLLKDNFAVPCTVKTENSRVTLTPGESLGFVSQYKGIVTTLVKDLSGNALASEYAWTFTTRNHLDVTYPSVISTSPSSGATNVPVATSVAAFFKEPILASTANAAAFKVFAGSSEVNGTVSLDATGKMLTFTSASPLAYATSYTAVISTAIHNLSGNALQQEYRWSFTTQAQPVQVYPTVISTSPSANANNIPIATLVAATFSEPISASTVNATAFKVLVGSSEVSGAVSLDSTGRVMTFTPTSTLAYATVYTGVLATTIRNLSGNALQQEYRWSFTTTGVPFTPFALTEQYRVVNVTTDESGNVYVYGYFNPSAAPTDTDIFVARFDANGKYHWMKMIHTEVTDWPQGGIVATGGYVYIQRVRDPVGSGSTDIFVDKLTSTDGIGVWSVTVGSGVMASSIAADEAGNVYATNTRETVKLDTNGLIVRRATNGGSVSAYAFNGLFVAGTTYQESTQLTDRYLVRMDSTLSSIWTEWLRNSRNTDVRGLTISKNDSYVYVAEDSFTVLPNGVQFYPFISAYKYKILGGVGIVESAWTKSLTGGRVNAVTSGTTNALYAVNATPNKLVKLRSVDGGDIWSVTLPKEGLNLAEFGDTFIFVADGTNMLQVYDAQTGVRKF